MQGQTVSIPTRRDSVGSTLAQPGLTMDLDPTLTRRVGILTVLPPQCSRVALSVESDEAWTGSTADQNPFSTVRVSGWP